MNDVEKDKVKRFMNDAVLNTAVKNQLTYSFLKKRPDRDVNMLAAQTLAFEFLDEAWKDMSRLKDNKEEEPEIKKQVGL